MQISNEKRYCDHCNNIVSPKTYEEYGEVTETCPICGSSAILSVTVCEDCGKEFTTTGESICPDCTAKAIAIWNAAIAHCKDSMTEEQLEYISSVTDGEPLFQEVVA